MVKRWKSYLSKSDREAAAERDSSSRSGRRGATTQTPDDDLKRELAQVQKDLDILEAAKPALTYVTTIN